MPVCYPARPEFPAVAELLPQAAWPDPLRMFDNSPVHTPEQWYDQRRPELKALFQHYMYGYFAPAPARIDVQVLFEDQHWLNNTATLKEVAVRYHHQAPVLHLLVGTPHQSCPAPVFTGPNFGGNHTEVDHPQVAISSVWMPDWVEGVVNNRATAAGRGKRKKFDFTQALARGYAVATFYHGDIDPDKPDFTDGVHPHYSAGRPRTPQSWGTIAAWAWGLSRAVDYLVTDPAIDPRRIASLGHSRNGKTALLAAAFDERIALAIPHQAGMGGSAPSRGTTGESVKQINTMFPHWFCDEYKLFNDRLEFLPFDQHCLAALCAPRPVLFSNAADDQWANPAGQFAVLKAATPVYQLLGVDGLEAAVMPGPDQETLLTDRLGYFYRPGGHDMLAADWKAFLDFADHWL
jgi:hypothetical protein